MMNISIDSSVFPSEWKTALVAPLQKDGPRDDVNNYRPIAVLPMLSKILEKPSHLLTISMKTISSLSINLHCEKTTLKKQPLQS